MVWEPVFKGRQYPVKVWVVKTLIYSDEKVWFDRNQLCIALKWLDNRLKYVFDSLPQNIGALMPDLQGHSKLISPDALVEATYYCLFAIEFVKFCLA